ncbi:unnamed protein product [Lactuca virosa]|uniref:Uncharacterized protein n=1 Tax=Lactuca virosa TaxID=75947 RepID=A0AAU9MJJ9_9ASTR|nr:unnamed protein product [Lactuca virosa]
MHLLPCLSHTPTPILISPQLISLDITANGFIRPQIRRLDGANENPSLHRRRQSRHQEDRTRLSNQYRPPRNLDSTRRFTLSISKKERLPKVHMKVESQMPPFLSQMKTSSRLQLGK